MFTRREVVAGATTLALSGPAKAVTGARRLSNPHASAEARSLYAYLWSIYGRRTLTGQQECPAPPRTEFDYLVGATGRKPALLDLDCIDPAEWRGVAQRAID